MNARNRPKSFAFICEHPCSSVAAKHKSVLRRPSAFVLVWLLFCAVSAASAQEELQTFKHPAWVGSVVFSGEGGEMFTACADGNVREWSALSGKEVNVLYGPGEIVSSLLLDKDRTRLIAGTYDGKIRMWHRTEDNWSESTTRDAHRGAVLALASDARSSRITSGGMDGTIHFEFGSRTTSLTAHRSWVNSLDLSRGGLLLASGSSDGTVRIWNVVLGGANQSGEPIEATKAEVRCVKFAPRPALLAVGLRYGDVQLWDEPSRKQLKSFKAHDGDCWAVKFSPDGKTLITGGGDWGKPGEVKLWDVKSGELKATLKHSGEVLSLAVTPLGRGLAAGGGDGNVKVWNTEKLIDVPKAE